MELKKNNNKGVQEKEFTVREFFEFVTQVYLGQMKRKSFYTDNSHLNIYNELVRLIQNKIAKSPERAEDYMKMLDITDRFYELVTDESIRNEIIEKDVRIPEFVSLYKERILGDHKRKYDMSDMFRDDYISSTVDRVTGQKRKKIVYIGKTHPEHVYQNNSGQTITIEEIGRLYMEEWNGVGSDISKYRIQTQVGEDEYLVDEIYSNIRIIEMDNPQYREAIFGELLSENNIALSNTNGYVGEIINLPSDLRNESVGAEQTVGGETYLYKINDRYALKYDGKDASAVMMFEQGQQMKNNSKIIPIRKKIKKAEESEETKGEETINQGVDVDESSR